MTADRLPTEESHDGPSPNGGLSRRDFLVRSALVAGTASIAGRTPAVLASQPSQPPPEQLPDVVQVRSNEVVTLRGLHEGVLLDMLNLLLRQLTNRPPADAWRTILHPDDVIGLKFNSSGADGLGTTDSLMRVLVQSLTDAGFVPERMIAVEVSAAIRAETRTLAPIEGWNERVLDFGSGTDQLAAWLDRVTAIINVPFLKTHNIAGMTACLKNLSHALVKHPAQFHANACSPYIGDIVALPAIRSKLRLHLVNALRVVFDGGPSAVEECIWDAGVLLGGKDPVALDCVGLQLIDRVRMALNLPPISGPEGPPAYLAAAADRGLGTDRLHVIRVHKAEI